MKKTLHILGFLVTSSLFSLSNTFAASLVIEVPDDPEPTKETIAYQCDIDTKKERVEATYLNAGNISLVDFKWKGKRIIGSRSMSASGAKFVGGQYVWWTTKNEAVFYDLISDPKEEKPIRCVEEEQETK
ncbi:MliC family protein [Bartonella birtlesii]|uniref:C-type lysozyme inhibitor domain-containing protein n=1 Tax=Bartonella birtlesii LL-WM9 TaxID=1094552 RepID=J1IYW6_9HYPH|nr:MliC family protein [Bartonella birtlesii]EJF76470.1 hypothetical protein ME7_01014 [Bartonella birtlesii LL-WM9]